MLCSLLWHSPKWAHILLPFFADHITFRELGCIMHVYNALDVSLLQRALPSRQASELDARLRQRDFWQRVVCICQHPLLPVLSNHS